MELTRSGANLAGLAAALSMLVASFATAAGAPADRKVDELMHKSGVWDQIAGISAGLPSAVTSDQITPEQASRLKAALGAGFASDVMRSRVRASLAKSIAVSDVDAALNWFDSDSGRTFTKLEGQYNSEPLGT